MPLEISLKTESLKALFLHPVFLPAASALCIAQVLKTAVFLLSGRRGKARELIEITIWRTGGMPSSHSALVTAMSTSIAFAEGIASTLFVLSFWFTLVVMRDALGVRRSAGVQARALNNLGRQMAEKFGVVFHPVKEVQGHTPLEVVVGALLGIFIAAGFALL
ncbi:MAG TPA: acid phosphatase [Treponema sp.]|nr:acid phosphatase [Treponema sp.]